jgi:hypothetical protein
MRDGQWMEQAPASGGGLGPPPFLDLFSTGDKPLRGKELALPRSSRDEALVNYEVELGSLPRLAWYVGLYVDGIFPQDNRPKASETAKWKVEYRLRESDSRPVGLAITGVHNKWAISVTFELSGIDDASIDINPPLS